MLIVRGRKSKDIWSHLVLAKGVMPPYPAKNLLVDLDFVGYKRVILKSDQELGTGTHCESVKKGRRGETVPEASPKGESESNREVERAVRARTGENPQGFLWAAVWNHIGGSKSGAGIVPICS